MRDPEPIDCGRVRRTLLERAAQLHAPPAGADVAAHLDACEACRKLAGHLAVTRSSFRDAAAYHPALRHRALAAVARHREQPPWISFWLVPAALLLGVVLSFVVPLWLAEQVLRPLLGSSPLTVALGLAAVCSQAVLAAGALTVTVILNRRPAAPLARPVLEV